jgi:hypothetical protein
MPEDQAFEPPLEQRRTATVDLLCEHFAADRLTVEEFERRLDTAHRTADRKELDALLADLPRSGGALSPRGQANQATGPGHPLASPELVRDRDMLIAILGGSGRKGRWIPARQTMVLAVMGGAELDFREAVLPPGVTEVQVYAFWGGVDIVVPPDVQVESHGFAVLGGFEHAAEGAATPSASTPTIRITGIAVMGGVHISVRHPGESARDARRRRRVESKERRRLSDGS